MPKFDYLVEKLPNYTDLEQWLNELGERGWELVHVDGMRHIFKREHQTISFERVLGDGGVIKAISDEDNA